MYIYPNIHNKNNLSISTNFKKWLETANFQDSYAVTVSGYGDQPVLEIPEVGFIRLFLTQGDYWVVHMIRGEQQGAGTVLYFAALLWALTEKKFSRSTHGRLISDTTLSPDAIRARNRMQQQYGDYLYITEHPSDSVKVHRGDSSDWRRPATSEEATTWRLKKMPPFEYEFKSQTS